VFHVLPSFIYLFRLQCAVFLQPCSKAIKDPETKKTRKITIGEIINNKDIQKISQPYDPAVILPFVGTTLRFLSGYTDLVDKIQPMVELRHILAHQSYVFEPKSLKIDTMVRFIEDAWELSQARHTVCLGTQFKTSSYGNRLLFLHRLVCHDPNQKSMYKKFCSRQSSANSENYKEKTIVSAKTIVNNLVEEIDHTPEIALIYFAYLFGTSSIS
jgi:hypothetical protein